MTLYTEKFPRRNTAAGATTLDVLARYFRKWRAAQRLQAAIAAERRQLREMPDEMLRDIGVSRASAEQESRRTDIPRSRACF